MTTISGTIPHKDAEEAKRRGYRFIRTLFTPSPDGRGIIGQRTQVRTGFDIETGQEIWKDLEELVSENEWRAELVSMSPSEFAKFIAWIWQGEEQ